MAKDLSLYPHRHDPGTLLLDKVIHEFLNRLRFQEALLCTVLARPGRRWASPQLCVQLLKLAGQRACQAALGGPGWQTAYQGNLATPSPTTPKDASA